MNTNRTGSNSLCVVIPFHRLFIVLAFVLTLAACGGGGGGASSDSHSVVMNLSPYTGDQCSNGGITVESGIDENGNGVLDDSEVDNTQIVCNGETGSTGTTGSTGSTTLISPTVESAGANCDTGGQRVDAGEDTDGDDTLDAGEITSTAYICSGDDVTSPFITSKSPDANEIDVDVSSTVSVTFSEEMTSSTINTSSFYLDNSVTGAVAYDSGTKTATFTPSAYLSYDTFYTVTLSSGITDANGQALSGVSWSFTSDYYAPFTRIINKHAPDMAANDSFGYSVSIDGDYAIVGAYLEDGGAGDPKANAGAAYIFHRDPVSGTWDDGVKIVASDAAANDYFGYSVSIDGDYAIVGARGKTSSTGAAYIYNRTGTNTWDSGAKITASDGAVLDQFGFSVAIDGDYAIVGAYLEDGGAGDPADAAGAAYIYNRTGTNAWDGGVKIVANDAAASDYFGISVAIDGDYAIVGAYAENSATGAAYIYNRTGTNTWDAGVKIVANDAATGDWFGFSVAIDGDYAIVGAHYENSNTGAAYIHSRTGANTWDSGAKITANDAEAGDLFGYSVAIDGDYAIVGAKSEDGGDGNPKFSAGAAYIYNRTDTWDAGTKITANDAATSDLFGISVSIDGDYAIVGAYGEDGGAGDPANDAGAAYIFE